MQKRILFLVLVVVASFTLNAQPYVYLLSGSLTEQGGTGPTLIPSFELPVPCLPSVPGTFSILPESVTSACATPTVTRTVFDFPQGSGLTFDNSGDLITASYVINVLFKFDNPTAGGFQRIIDFSNGTRDGGVYVAGPGLLAVDGNVIAGYTFAAGTYAYLTLVRDDANSTLSVYVDGVFLQTLALAVGDPFVPVPGTVITLFTDDQSGPCDEGSGAVAYWSLDSPVTLPSAADVTASFNSLCTTVLPLTLLDFTAAKQAGGVLLKWTTETELNTNRFELERSSDGRTFSKIGSVPSNNIYTGRNNYTYLDAAPLSGTDFYRLKMVDNDARYKYSNILKLNFSGIQKFEVFPNPAKSSVTISGIQVNQSVKLMNAQGVQLAQLRSTGESMTLDLSKYPSGVYVITYSDGQTVQQKKIVKE